jgi:hypothetical protein
MAASEDGVTVESLKAEIEENKKLREIALAEWDRLERLCTTRFDLVSRERAVKIIRIAGLSGFTFGVAGALIGCLLAGWL